ncbi:MAG: CdaR family protein [Chloroflexota bacterium]
MNAKTTRWARRNLGTLLMAFALAVIVWVSAVTSADPNQEKVFSVPIEIIGLPAELELINSPPDRAQIKLYAPGSVLEKITQGSNTVEAWVDLSDLGSGEHAVALQYQVAPEFSPVRVNSIQPANIEISLEEITSRTLLITTDIKGEPKLGYQAEVPTWSDAQVEISGRTSLVEQVDSVSAVLDIDGADENIEVNIKLIAQDAAGHLLSNIVLTPSEVAVQQPITLRGGYRNMVVKVVTVGQVVDGYRQTSIAVTPPNIMLFSANPALLDELPSFIETEPLDLTGAVEDIAQILALALPTDVSVVGDPNVLVEIGLTAMQTSITVTRPVEVIGVLPEFGTLVDPEVVEVIIFGPIPTLDALTETDVRVVLDLTGLEIGVYQLTPQVVILPEEIQSEAILPGTIEVRIIPISEMPLTPTPTPTPTLTP